MTAPARMDRHLYVGALLGGFVKVGSSWHPRQRVATLRTRFPGLVLAWQTPEPFIGRADRVETTAHNLLGSKRVAGEWFVASVEEAIEVVQQALAIVAGGDQSMSAFPSPPRLCGAVDAKLIEAGIRRVRPGDAHLFRRFGMKFEAGLE